MKRPIEPADIRAGDLIRCEWPNDSASEWRSKTSGPAGWNAERVSYFLLDRPTPPVELPTEPTLGWLENVYGARILKHWFRGEGVAEAFDGDRWNFTKEVIGFTPAVAVPEAALDELRGVLAECSGKVEDEWPHMPRAVERFLAAVDEANA